MTRKFKRHVRGIAEPILVREPLLLRSCSAFVNNLTLILKTAFIVGAILLARDFRSLTQELGHAAVEVEPALLVHEVEIEPTAEPEPQEPLLSERVQHYLNCTFEDYRTTHYDECVEGPSRIYQRPQAKPDDIGNLPYTVRHLYADMPSQNIIDDNLIVL